MPLEVKKQGKELSQSLVRRFSRRMKQSGILVGARRAQFKQKPKSQQMRRRSALKREELRKEYAILEKMGKPRS